MNFFIAVFGGGLAGVIVALFIFNIRSQDLVLINILAGIVGGILGFMVYTLGFASLAGEGDFTISGVLCDIIGALAIVALINLIQILRRRSKKFKDIEKSV
jgi:uncharacterized membrane protein YeaQ/YmgE (transglycosylase-associated protein family)